MAPTTIDVDVSGKVPLDGAHYVATWVFPPDDAGELTSLRPEPARAATGASP